jgi:hypothetical protein
LTSMGFSLHYHGLVSRTDQIPKGLPQGATMSRTLYGIFSSDPPELSDCEMAVFADNTAIFCNRKSRMNVKIKLRESLITNSQQT